MLNPKDISRNFYDETNDESVLPYACMRAEFEGKLLKNCPKQLAKWRIFKIIPDIYSAFQSIDQCEKGLI